MVQLEQVNPLKSNQIGGRYDGLIGMFGNKEIPSVGCSFGVERLFVLLERMHAEAGWLRGPSTHILVTSIGKGMAGERIKLLSELWKGDLFAEMMYEENQKPQKALTYSLENKVPFIIWIGSNEIEQGFVTLKVSNL